MRMRLGTAVNHFCKIDMQGVLCQFGFEFSAGLLRVIVIFEW